MERKSNKDDNRGYSTVFVLSVIAAVAILAAVLLTLTLSTFRMKTTYTSSQQSFYNAESVLDDINTGLQKDVADAAGEAYAYMLEHYSNATDEERRAYYEARFYDSIRQILASNYRTYRAGGLTYSLDHLTAMISDEVKNGAKNRDSEQTPLLSCPDNTCWLNEDDSKGTVTIKDLKVTYVDRQDCTTRIVTDIEIACPPLDMDPTAASPLDLAGYVIVANDQTVVSDAGEKTIKGNAYLGDSGADLSQGTIHFIPTADAGKITTAGEFYVRSAAQVTVDENLSLWAKEVHVDSAKSLSLNGNSYINDDLVIDNSLGVGNVSVSLSGRFYAYGNPATAAESACFAENEADAADLSRYPSRYSSAILINGRNVTLDMSGLDDLILSGTAYVGTEKADQSAVLGNSNVQMGESVALKASQRAYLVPSEFLASYCVAGGRNPMTEDTYNLLLNEIVQKRDDYVSTSQVEDLDFIRCGASSSAEIPEELRELHVKGVSKQVCQINTGAGKVINMVYFFLEFESEGDVISYSCSRYATGADGLEARIDTRHYNTSITYPSMMYDEFEQNQSSVTDFQFYYNGSLIVPSNEGANTSVMVGQGTLVSSRASTALGLREQEFQNIFAAMKHALLNDYALLEDGQKTKNLYHNLVDTGKLAFLPGRKVFVTGKDGVADDSQMAAIVANGNCTLTGNGEDAMEDGYPVHLVIASGDVTVDCNYRGLIIAGGDIRLTMRATAVEANASMVQKALQISDEDGNRPLDYLVNGISYLSSAGGSDAGGSGDIRYADCVTYRNWSKQ